MDPGPSCLLQHMRTACCSLLRPELPGPRKQTQKNVCDVWENSNGKQQVLRPGWGRRGNRQPMAGFVHCASILSNSTVAFFELLNLSSYSPVSTIKKLFTLVSIFFCLSTSWLHSMPEQFRSSPWPHTHTFQVTVDCYLLSDSRPHQPMCLAGSSLKALSTLWHIL